AAGETPGRDDGVAGDPVAVVRRGTPADRHREVGRGAVLQGDGYTGRCRRQLAGQSHAGRGGRRGRRLLAARRWRWRLVAVVTVLLLLGRTRWRRLGNVGGRRPV